MTRRVVGAVAVIPDGEGVLRYFYQGAYLPSGLNSDAVERCIGRGLVVETDDPDPADTGDLTDSDLDQGDDPDEDDGDEDLESDGEDDEEPAPARPKNTASTQAWRDYRRPTHGDAVDGLNRQQLIELG